MRKREGASGRREHRLYRWQDNKRLTMLPCLRPGLALGLALSLALGLHLGAQQCVEVEVGFARVRMRITEGLAHLCQSLA